MSTLMLFDWKPPAQRHSETSKAAAETIKPSSATLRMKVLGALRSFGPMTDEELQQMLGMNPSTQRPRRGELVEDGLVENSGTTRRTLSGRNATVWRARQ